MNLIQLALCLLLILYIYLLERKRQKSFTAEKPPPAKKESQPFKVYRTIQDERKAEHPSLSKPPVSIDYPEESSPLNKFEV